MTYIVNPVLKQQNPKFTANVMRHGYVSTIADLMDFIEIQKGYAYRYDHETNRYTMHNPKCRRYQVVDVCIGKVDEDRQVIHQSYRLKYVDDYGLDTQNILWLSGTMNLETGEFRYINLSRRVTRDYSFEYDNIPRPKTNIQRKMEWYADGEQS